MNQNVATLFQSSVDTEALTDKQKAVLKASLTLFAQKGYEATSTHDIAALAGVAEGTVYKVFKTKEGLLAAIMTPFIEGVLPQVMGEFVQAIDAQEMPDLKAALTFMIHDRLQFVMDSRREVKVFAQLILRDPEILQTLQAKVDTLIGDHYSQLLAPLKRSGQLVDWPAMRILRYIFGTLLSYVLPTILLDTPAPDLDAITAESVEFLMRGLSA
ncbi:TetR/AcrR family transcriptional regulator [Lacticaseibacillus sp. GG6-2]